MAEFLEEDCSTYVPGTRVEPVPNSEYAPISEMRLITRDYGTCTTAKQEVIASRREKPIYRSSLGEVPQTVAACEGKVPQR